MTFEGFFNSATTTHSEFNFFQRLELSRPLLMYCLGRSGIGGVSGGKFFGNPRYLAGWPLSQMSMICGVFSFSVLCDNYKVAIQKK